MPRGINDNIGYNNTEKHIGVRENSSWYIVENKQGGRQARK